MSHQVQAGVGGIVVDRERALIGLGSEGPRSRAVQQLAVLGEFHRAEHQSRVVDHFSCRTKGIAKPVLPNSIHFGPQDLVALEIGDGRC